ncbi:hypothetical protein DENIS_4989 [Desulfonema ishimotonii]|uniref:Uncharacterized protein n=1 Tax=Desulfonema ishimotonii TaxID=45657 RepID=A0A401G424_9BACT|nr:hypothetical protein [Desulfonema ishimotonii]GBC63989.1 hypothetical protein DENIS_4989 [Desulfonema ishimotonii]
MALDELRNDDNTYEIEGFTYLVNKDFMEKVKPVKVDFSDVGFKLSCGVEFSAGGGCSGCGTTSNCCS